jgi:NMD protein affecting ribosome stability and mRNA decay
MNEHDPNFAQDLLRGAEEIAQYLFNDRSARRKVYHLVATSRLPHFKLGSMICTRKSTLEKWIQEQENRLAANL